MISSVPMPQMFWMSTVKVVVPSGDAYGNCRLGSFNGPDGLHNQASPSAPGSCTPNPSQISTDG